ncbi:MAG TPA: M14 family metallopeptidase [bacterium]|nr:M14 family metallopeptidase [bacterium]
MGIKASGARHSCRAASPRRKGAGQECPAHYRRVLLFIALLLSALSWPASGARAAAAEAAGLGPYPPLSAVYEEISALASAHPELASLEVIGQSVEGRPIYAFHIGRQDGQRRPEALLTADIHAGEVLSSRVALGAATRLLEDDGKDPWITSLLDRTDFWIVPVLNPDGYNRVIVTGGKGGDIGTRRNAHGVDLNRNYTLAPGAHSRHPLAGNRRPRSQYYMGPGELSEPETSAIAVLADSHDFYVSISGHTVAGKFLYPYCFTKRAAPDREAFIRAGQAFAARQPRVKYKVQQSYSWYPTLGDMDDFLYLRHGVMSFTVEHGKVAHNLKYALAHRPVMFWVMNPIDADQWVMNDRDALLAAVEEALELTGGKPLPLPVPAAAAGQ